MNNSDKDNRRWIGLIVFAVAAGFTFAFGRLLLAPGIGPSAAASWAAEAIDAGSGSSAVYAPYFRLFCGLIGVFIPDGNVASVLNYLTLTGHSLMSGFAAVLFLLLFTSSNIWAAPMLAAWGGIIVGLSRYLLASSLMVNPATFSLLFIVLSAIYLVRVFQNRKADKLLSLIKMSSLFIGLAIAFHLAALIVLPAYLVLLLLLDSEGKFKIFVTGLVGLTIPVLGFILPMETSIFNTTGLLTAAPGLPSTGGLSQLGSSFLYSLTPVGAVIALWGIVSIFRINLKNVIVLITIIIGIIAAAIVLPEGQEFAAILISLITAALVVLGIIDLLRRFPGGVGFGLWIFIPFIWWYHGTALSRSSETIWETHVSNTIRTVRLNSLVLSVDDELINAPYSYLRKAKTMRPDVFLVNPVRLGKPSYLDYLQETYPKRIDQVNESFESLYEAVGNKNIPINEKNAARDSFLVDLIKHGVKYDGVLVSPGYTPPIMDYTFVPEGLFVRLLPENADAYPFHFSGLNMDPIILDPEAPLLKQRLVAMYPMMFTSRGSWMLKKQFTAEGIEYIRWALKIDPDYIPAKLVAKDYGIKGPPQSLGK